MRTRYSPQITGTKTEARVLQWKTRIIIVGMSFFENILKSQRLLYQWCPNEGRGSYRDTLHSLPLRKFTKWKTILQVNQKAPREISAFVNLFSWYETFPFASYTLPKPPAENFLTSLTFPTVKIFSRFVIEEPNVILFSLILKL